MEIEAFGKETPNMPCSTTYLKIIKFSKYLLPQKSNYHCYLAK